MTWLLSTTPDYNKGPSCGGEVSVEANLQRHPTRTFVERVIRRLLKAQDKAKALTTLQHEVVNGRSFIPGRTPVKAIGRRYGCRPQSVNREQERRSVDDGRALAVERDGGLLH